jgi:hypothetical protein
VYRGHEGTVYSLDVSWKNGVGPRRPTSANRHKLAPYDENSEAVVLVTGFHILREVRMTAPLPSGMFRQQRRQRGKLL